VGSVWAGDIIEYKSGISRDMDVVISQVFIQIGESLKLFFGYAQPIWEAIKQLFMSLWGVVCTALAIVRASIYSTWRHRCRDVWYLVGGDQWNHSGTWTLYPGGYKRSQYNNRHRRLRHSHTSRGLVGCMGFYEIHSGEHLGTDTKRLSIRSQDLSKVLWMG
jgi:hypothetical protein